MKTLFLHHWLDGQLIKDPEGAAFDDLRSARREALASAREIVAAELLRGRGLIPVTVEIVDEYGATLLSVPFDEAIQADLTEPAQLRSVRA
jgi:hypothetical protein